MKLFKNDKRKGGQIFSTLNSTITKRIKRVDSTNSEDFYEPSLLQSLLSGLLKVHKDRQDAIFIDRDPKYFQTLLNYLRYVNTNQEY